MDTPAPRSEFRTRLDTNRPAKSADRLDGFQPEFTFVLGVGFADPDHAAPLADGRVFIEDKLDHLAAPNVETSAQPETLF